MPILTVLWMLAVVAATAISILGSSIAVHRAAHNESADASARLLVEAAVNRAVLNIIGADGGPRWRTDGGSSAVLVGQTAMSVSIQDTLGLIDINQVDTSVLENLFLSVGLDQRAAVELSEKVVAWRGSPSKLEHNYTVASEVLRARHGAFQSVEEMQLIKGISADIFERLRPVVTVYSGRQFVDGAVAPREVLLALSNMSAGGADEFLRPRDSQQSRAGRDAEPTQSAKGRAFTVGVEFKQGNASIRHRVTLRVTDDPAHAFWVLSWRES